MTEQLGDDIYEVAGDFFMVFVRSIRLDDGSVL